jgi:hypothetical protein
MKTGTHDGADHQAAGGSEHLERRDAYGQRSGASGGFTGREAVGTETAGDRLPHDARGMTRDADGREHFDAEYRQWRNDQAHAMDRDYEEWRRHRFARDFSDWRSIRAAQAGLRTGSGGPDETHADRERLLRGDVSRYERDPDDRTEEAKHGD